MTEEKMCEDFRIWALSLEPVCPPTFCLISPLFTEGHGDSPFIIYIGFQVLLFFPHQKKVITQHSPLPTM